MFAATFIGSIPAEAQITFSSGSTGADGALNITAAGVTYFDPVALHLTANTNIFNFTTITIALGSALVFSELKFHGPVYFLAQGDVNINGYIFIGGGNSPGPTATAAEQSISFAGSGGYSGGLGGVHGDASHPALPGNGPAGGAAGDINSSGTYAVGGGFSTNRFLVPLVGGSGGGGINDNGQYGAQGGPGGGAILIASSTRIVFDSKTVGGHNGRILAFGGWGSDRGCGGAGGAVRLVANTITWIDNNNHIQVQTQPGGACKTPPSNGLVRIESNSTNFTSGNIVGTSIFSVPYALNLPTAPIPVITVSSINGVAINANPFSFPDTTINTGTAVPVVITATNVPLASTVTLYLLSDTQPNQTVTVTLTGTNAASSATVNVVFPSGGTRGFVKAVFH